MPWYLRQLMTRGGYMNEANAGDGSGGGGGGGSQGGDGNGGNDGGGGNDGAGSGSPSGTKKPDDKPKISDAEAKLLQDMMKHKQRAEQAAAELNELRQKFDGIDPVKVRELLAKQAEEERKQAEARGEYDRLVRQMGEQHTAEKEAIKREVADREAKLAAMQGQIAELTIGSAFAQAASWIKQETVLTPTKARVIWGSHFEFKDGQVIAYDKPAGASERTPLVDAAGNPLSFEAALDKLVSVDPDADSIRRSKAKPGTGSNNQPGAKPGNSEPPRQLTGAQRIAAGLKKLNGGK